MKRVLKFMSAGICYLITLIPCTYIIYTRDDLTILQIAAIVLILVTTTILYLYAIKSQKRNFEADKIENDYEQLVRDGYKEEEIESILKNKYGDKFD